MRQVIASEQARYEALAERNEERYMLQDMLTKPDRGGLSKERVVALQELFKRKPPSAVPKSERGLAADNRARLEGLAEMAAARLRSSNLAEVAKEKEEERHEERLRSDGSTVSYSQNGVPSTKVELGEEGLQPNDAREEGAAPYPDVYITSEIIHKTFSA